MPMVVLPAEVVLSVLNTPGLSEGRFGGSCKDGRNGRGAVHDVHTQTVVSAHMRVRTCLMLLFCSVTRWLLQHADSSNRTLTGVSSALFDVLKSEDGLLAAAGWLLLSNSDATIRSEGAGMPFTACCANVWMAAIRDTICFTVCCC